MIHKLKRRLILLYTVSTSIILVIAMVLVYHLSLSRLQKQTLETFLLNVDSLVNQLQITNMVNLSELSILEADRHLIISIEDNGTPITFAKSYESKTDRSLLLSLLCEKATLEGVNIHNTSLISHVKRSGIIEITGQHHDKYYGYVVILPLNGSYITLSMLCSMTEIFSASNTNILIYFLISLAGILCFFTISFLLIGKVLRPVQENQKRQIEFVASASHELRSPLAYIQTASGELTQDCLPHLTGKASETLSSYLRNTREECSRMSQLIEDMLLLASADRKTWSLQMTNTDADTFFINSYDTLSPSCELKKHPLSLSLPDELIGILPMDSRRVYQILQILVSNALSHTPEGTPIIIHPYCQKKTLFVEVIDSGPGIPEAEKERVFERYYRRDTSRTETNHFGLGLSIARELALLHHGELNLKDTKGCGCTFTLSIPLNV